MQKPLINNRRLNEKWSAQTNELMIKKLQGVKPQINSRCPESFFFFKTQFKKASSRVTKLEKFEVAKNNENLLRKLLDVNIERNSKLNKSKTPVFTFKKNFLTGNKKYDIIKIAQENQSMLKRLNEKSSFYDINQWEKDYQMNQYYKRNHCVFPSIDFKRSNSGLLNHTIKAASPKQSLSTERKKYNNSYSNFGQFDDYNENCKENYIQINEDSQRDLPKILYKTQVYLGTLGSCIVEFAVQVQNFTIKIESIYEKERVYGIIFDSKKSVENIQKYYRKYEDMIIQLEYDEKNDVVKFNNLIKKDLVCRCIKLPPKVEINERKDGAETKLKEETLPILDQKKDEEKVVESKSKEKEETPMDSNLQDNKDQIVEDRQKNNKEEASKDIKQQDNNDKKEEENKQHNIKEDLPVENNKDNNNLQLIEEAPQTENQAKDNSKKEGLIEVLPENNQLPQEVEQVKQNENEENGGITEDIIKINN